MPIFRFGIIWVHIRLRHIYTPIQFENAIKSAFGNSEAITVTAVVAILDYKKYYDAFVDSHLVDHYSKLHYTQLLFKIETCREIDQDDVETYGLLVRTNY